MKKLIVTITVLVLASAAFAQTEAFAPLSPKSAEVMAMGGSFVSVAHGYNALLANPAGLGTKGDLTLLSVNPWLYLRPSTENVDAALSIVDGINSGTADPSAIVDMVNGLIVENGFGAGVHAGVGWAGNRVGLGAYSVNDFNLSGKTILGVNGTFESMTGLVFGAAVPLDLFGIRLSLGADARPYYRMRGFVKGTDLINSFLSSTGDFSTFWQAIPGPRTASRTCGLASAFSSPPIPPKNWLR